MPTPKELRARAAELLRLADEIEATIRRNLDHSEQLTRVNPELITKDMQDLVVRPGPELKSKGPIATVVRDLSLRSVRELGDLIDENERSLRTWDQRGRVPERVAAKMAALAKERKKAKKK